MDTWPLLPECGRWINIVMTTLLWLTSLTNLREKKLWDGRTGGDALYPRRLVLREVILYDFGTLYPIFHFCFRSLKPQNTIFGERAFTSSQRRFLWELTRSMMAYRRRELYSEDSAANLLRSVRQQVSVDISDFLRFFLFFISDSADSLWIQRCKNTSLLLMFRS